jgi:tetratricopeptide (TPR) repeat protein
VPELSSVPFFPQTDFDCGPAALATVLNWEGVQVAPDDLIDAVYIEGLQGSLQVELLAATRRYGLLPVPVQMDPSDLLAEVRSGRPVLVMQNLGFARAPRWHYAVVVGYSADAGRFILRSGEEERRRERVSRFLRSWQLAENWGFVAVQPGEIPVTAGPDAYMRALVGASEQLPDSSVALAYEAAVARWPEDSFVLFLAASREHALDRQQPAATLYRRLIEIDPEHAAARNNLANIYLERGCLEEAATEAERALELQSPDGDFLAAIKETLADIESAASNADGECLL